MTWERPGDTKEEELPKEVKQTTEEPSITYDLLPDGWEEVPNE